MYLMLKSKWKRDYNGMYFAGKEQNVNTNTGASSPVKPSQFIRVGENIC